MRAPSHRQMTGDAQMPAPDLDEERVAFCCPYREEMTNRPDGDANQPETKAEADGPGQRAVDNGDGARCAAEQDMLGQRPMDRDRKSRHRAELFEAARHQMSAPPPNEKNDRKKLDAAKAMELGRGFTEQPRRWAVGMLLSRLGWAREQAGKTDAARGDYRRAVELLQAEPDTEESKERRNPVSVITVERVAARQRLAVLAGAEEKWPDARRHLETSVLELKEVIVPGRYNRMAYQPLIDCYQKLAEVCEQIGDADAAEQARAAMEKYKILMSSRDRKLPIAPPPREVTREPL